MYTKKSVPKIKSGAASGKDPNVIYVNVKDIQTFPTTNDNGILSTSDLVLKEGQKAFGVYATSSTITFGAPGSGDPDSKGFTATVGHDHPGNSLAFDEWVQNNINENFVIIVKGCGTADETRIFGRPCAPMAFETEETNDNSATKSTVTSTQVIPSEFKPIRYVGADVAVYEDWTPEVEEEEGA